MMNGKVRYLLILLAAVLCTTAALILIPEKDSPREDSTSQGTAGGRTESTGTYKKTESPVTSAVWITLTEEKTTANVSTRVYPPVSSSETVNSSAPSSDASDEASSQGSSSESTVPVSSPEETESTAEVSSPDFSRVAFVGDSRTVFLGSGDERSAGLVPNSSLFATYGGTLTDTTALTDAENAGLAGRELAVFWFGVNDVQEDPERDDENVFIEHYRVVIDAFREKNPSAEIVILSVVGTSVTEWCYYEGQEENIDKYNEALRGYSAGQGFRFIDLSFMNTSEEDFLPDGIHFTKDWYDRFLPELLSLLCLN